MCVCVLGHGMSEAVLLDRVDLKGSMSSLAGPDEVGTQDAEKGGESGVNGTEERGCTGGAETGVTAGGSSDSLKVSVRVRSPLPAGKVFAHMTFWNTVSVCFIGCFCALAFASMYTVQLYCVLAFEEVVLIC